MQNNDFKLKSEFINLLNVSENNPIILLNLLNEDVFSQYFDFYLNRRELIVGCHKSLELELYVSLLDWFEDNVDQAEFEELRKKYQLLEFNIIDFCLNDKVFNEDTLTIRNANKYKSRFVFNRLFKEDSVIKIEEIRKILNIIGKVYNLKESELLLEDCTLPRLVFERISKEFNLQLLKELKKPDHNGFSEWQNNTFFNFWNAYMLRKYFDSREENFGIISGKGILTNPFHARTQKIEKEIDVKNEEWIRGHIPLFNMYFLEKKEDMEKIAYELELLLRALFLNRYTSYIHISSSIKKGKWGALNEKLKVLNEKVTKSERKFRQKKLEELLKAEIDFCLKEAEKIIKPLIELH